MLDAVGAGEDGGFRRLAGLGLGAYGGAVGVDAEFDDYIEQDRNRLAVFHGGQEAGFAEGVDRAFVEAEADRTGYGDFAGFAVGAHHDVILGDAGDAMVLRELVGCRVEGGDEAGLFVD